MKTRTKSVAARKLQRRWPAVLLTAPFIAAALHATANPRTLSSGPSDAVQCQMYAQRADTPPRKAIGTCSMALERGALDKETRVATHANRALIYRRHGRLELAAADCRAVFEQGLSMPAAAVTCSAVFIQAGQPAEAIELLYGSDLPSAEERHKHYHNLALAHHDLGQYDQAYHYLQKTLAAKPDFQPAIALKRNYTPVTPSAK